MAETETRIELAIPSPQKLFTPVVTVILVLMVIGYALTIYAKNFTTTYLALSATGVFSGKIWQLVTYPFIDGNMLILIFHLFLVLFVGSNIEREWRSKELILFWLIVSTICGLIWVVVCQLIGTNYLGWSAAACGFGLISAFGLLFRRKKFIAWFWVMQAQHAAWGLIVIGIIFSIPQPITFIWLTGALSGYFYVKLRRRMLYRAGTAPQETYRPQSFVDID